MATLLRATVAAAALAASAFASAAPMQWTTAAGGNGHWYEYFGGPVDWNAARAAALASTHQGQQGYLATITSAAENRFAAGVAGDLLAWLGGSDAAVEGRWIWVDGPEGGQLLSYTNWNGAEPNNCCGGEDYLQINWAVTGGWNDHGGPGNPNHLIGYLVEYADAPAGVPAPATPALVLAALAAGAWVRRRRG